MSVRSIPLGKRHAAMGASVLLLASFTAVGQATIATNAGAAGTISVTCLDWYDSNKNKWHVEAHVKDGNGNGVVGAKVFFQNSVDPTGPAGPSIYQTSTSTTSLYGGVGKGATCGTRKSTTVTSDQCAPANSPKGLYTSKVVNVIPPAGSGLVWDGVTPANSYTRG